MEKDIAITDESKPIEYKINIDIQIKMIGLSDIVSKSSPKQETNAFKIFSQSLLHKLISIALTTTLIDLLNK